MVCNFFFAETSWSVFQKGGHRGWNEIFDGIGRLLARFCHRPKQRPLFRSILRSFIGLWAKIGHWNKTACSESKPAQRSRSKSTTSPKKGRLLRFRSNRWTAQQLQMAVRKKLGNDVWHDSELIATKVWSHIDCKWNSGFELNVETSLVWSSFDFGF